MAPPSTPPRNMSSNLVSAPPDLLLYRDQSYISTTPRKDSLTQRHSYKHIDDVKIAVRRKELVQATPCIPVEPGDFLTSTLPAVAEFDQIYQSVKDSEQQVLISNGWRELQRLVGTEKKVYNEALQRIHGVVMAAMTNLSGDKQSGDQRNQSSQSQKTEYTDGDGDGEYAPSDPDVIADTHRLRLICDGDRGFVSERESTHRPDAGLYFTSEYRKSVEDPSADSRHEEKPRVYVEDVVACGEFKVHNDDDSTRDNHEKIMYDGLALLKDPCRRFAFGLSILGVKALFYFFSRSFVLKSTEFNINTEPHYLITFFAALAHASESPEQLGWDPTVQRFLDDTTKLIHYRYEIGKRWFQTENQLTDERVNDMIGRGTRVWQVVEVIPDGHRGWKKKSSTKYALKDVWMDANETQEAITIKTIRFFLSKWIGKYGNRPADCSPETDLEQHDQDGDCPFDHSWLDELEGNPEYEPDAAPNRKDEDWNAPYNRYFPRVVTHGFVRLSDKKVDQGTALFTTSQLGNLAQRNYTPFTVPADVGISKAPRTHVHQQSSIRRTSGQIVTSINEEEKQEDQADFDYRLAFRPINHYRQVTHDLAEPLGQVTKLRVVLLGLADAAIGLRWLFRAGHIHRDLSPGNLLCRIAGDHEELRVCTQLSDFQYCRLIKPRDDYRPGVIKTATTDFMACEVLDGEWRFTPLVDLHENLPTPENLDPANTNDIKSLKHIVFPTPLHDLESILWMVLWSICGRPLGGREQVMLWQAALYKHVFKTAGSKEQFINKRGNTIESRKQISTGIAAFPPLMPIMLIITDLVQIMEVYHKTYQQHIMTCSEANPRAYADDQAPAKIVRCLEKIYGLRGELDQVDGPLAKRRNSISVSAKDSTAKRSKA